MSPRFLYSRTPPCPPEIQQGLSSLNEIMTMAQKKGLGASFVKLKERIRIAFCGLLLEQKGENIQEQIKRTGKRGMITLRKKKLISCKDCLG